LAYEAKSIYTRKPESVKEKALRGLPHTHGGWSSAVQRFGGAAVRRFRRTLPFYPLHTWHSGLAVCGSWLVAHGSRFFTLALPTDSLSPGLLKKAQMQGGAPEAERDVLAVRRSERRGAVTQQLGLFQQPVTGTSPAASAAPSREPRRTAARRIQGGRP
jgi:hypothetical protein